MQRYISKKPTKCLNKELNYVFNIWKRQRDSASDNTYKVYDPYKISITQRHKLKETTKE